MIHHQVHLLPDAGDLPYIDITHFFVRLHDLLLLFQIIKPVLLAIDQDLLILVIIFFSFLPVFDYGINHDIELALERALLLLLCVLKLVNVIIVSQLLNNLRLLFLYALEQFLVLDQLIVQTQIKLFQLILQLLDGKREFYFGLLIDLFLE